LSKALTISEVTTVSEACRRMATRRVDAVLLTDSNALLSGIMTDKVCVVCAFFFYIEGSVRRFIIPHSTQPIELDSLDKKYKILRDVCVYEILQACACVQDIATRVIAEGLRPEQTMVSKVMTRSPIFVTSDMLALEALQKMVQG